MLNYRETAQRLKITDFALRHAVSRNKMTPIKNAKGDGIGFSESYVDNLLDFAAGKKIKPKLIKKFELSPSGQKVLKEQLKMEENKKEVPEPTNIEVDDNKGDNETPKDDSVDSAQVKDSNPSNPNIDSDKGGNENEVQTDSAVNDAVVKIMSPAEVTDPTIDTVDVTPPEMKALSKLELEIKFYFEQISKNVFEIGKRLMQAKKMLKHGEWEKWLERNFELSDRTARRYIAIAERFGKTDTVSEIDFSTFKTAKLITLLGLAEGREQEFFAQLKAAGKDIAKLSNPELANDVKEFNAQVDAELAAKDEQIKSLDERIKKQSVQLDKITGENIRLENQLNDAEQSLSNLESTNQRINTQLATVESKLHDANKEIEELRNRPPEKEIVEKVPYDYENLKQQVAVIGDLDAAKTQLENEKAQLENDKKEFHKRVDLKAVLEIFKTGYARFIINLRYFSTPEAGKIRMEILPLFDEAFEKAMFWIENGVQVETGDPQQINLFDDIDPAAQVTAPKNDNEGEN